MRILHLLKLLKEIKYDHWMVLNKLQIAIGHSEMLI